MVKLCDFGVSLPLKADGSLDRNAAGENAQYIGTNLWSAPEVCGKTTCQIITDKADIFAYGVTIWEMLSKASPHCPDVSDQSFDEEAYEEMMDELIGTLMYISFIQRVSAMLTLFLLLGTRPLVPEPVAKDTSYSKVISLFIRCTEEKYEARFSAIEVLQYCNENSIH